MNGLLSLAKIFEDAINNTAYSILPPYMPPQARTPYYGKELDVFMFGMTLIELFGGQLDEKENKNIQKVKPKYFSRLTDSYTDFEPTNRPDSNKVVNHLRCFMIGIENEIKRIKSMPESKNYNAEKIFKKAYNNQYKNQPLSVRVLISHVYNRIIK